MMSLVLAKAIQKFVYKSSLLPDYVEKKANMQNIPISKLVDHCGVIK